MLKLIMLLVVSSGINLTAKADTVDYCRVFYNKKEIREYPLYSKGEILLKVKDIKENDSLTILYFRDTPCSECETNVIVENKQHFIITQGKGQGTFNPIKISVFDLLVKADRDYSYVYYYEVNGNINTPKIPLFKIKLE